MRYIPVREIACLIKVTARNWQADKAPRMGAALAYYITLSLAPTVLILLHSQPGVRRPGRGEPLRIPNPKLSGIPGSQGSSNHDRRSARSLPEGSPLVYLGWLRYFSRRPRWSASYGMR